MKLEDFAARLRPGDLWVFGYGSLMWSPCFPYRESRLARVHGYHRALCILSTRYRGTQPKPGLVMGLCRGGSCWGMAFRVPADDVPRASPVLASRDAAAGVRAAPRRRRVAGGRTRPRARLSRRSRASGYVRELDLHGRARLVAQGIGQRGPCIDYIRNTLEHMHELGVRDPHLERVLPVALNLQKEERSACAAARAWRRARCVPKLSRTNPGAPNCAPGESATPCCRKCSCACGTFRPSIHAR